jgi:alcohol dehydrogenase class IV
LRRVYEDGSNAAAREDMALASLFGGLALANAKLGAAHGFAGPIGGMVPAPHGVICARLLPHVMAANVRALRDRAPDSPVLSRLDEIGRIVTGRHDATAADGVAWVQDICRDLHVPPLARFGFAADRFAAAVEKSKNASSMKGNPIALTEEEMYGILEHESCGTSG